MQKKVIAAAAIIGALAVAQPLDKAEAKTDIYFGLGFGGPIVHHVHTPPRYYHRHGYGTYYNHHYAKPGYYKPKRRVLRKLRKRGFSHFQNVRWRKGKWRMTAISPRGHLVRLKVNRHGHILRRKIVRYYY